MDSDALPLRHCNKCDNDWPPTSKFWYLDKRRGTWRFPCKQCCKRETKEHQAWRLAHRDSLCEYNHLYGITHRDERASYRRVYRAEHVEWHAQYERKRSNLPQRKEQSVIHSRNRYARKKNTAGTHTATQIQELYQRQKGMCYYCHKKVKWGEHHVEHTFPVSRVAGTDIPANGISYLVMACKPCNLKKGDRYPWEWPEGGRLL